MKKYILLIALVVMAQVNNAQAEAASDLSSVTRLLVQDLNNTLSLERSEKLARLNQLIPDVQNHFERALENGASTKEILEIENCLKFISQQQNPPAESSAEELAQLMEFNDYRNN